MIDLVQITVKAGDGGDGAVSFRRERFIPKGGPNGGPGGKGGDIYLVADRNLLTLKDFQQKKHFRAEDGKRGGSNNKAGRGGKDLHLKVPVGTIVRQNTENRIQKTGGQRFPISYSPYSTSIVADLVEHDQTVLVARGGEGGRGNTSFRSSTNRAPRQFGKGKPGEEKVLILELKLIADVGLIGLPNAGKSTLLNALTRARAQVASYPFTTLEPNLGVMGAFVLADIPGLIEGASKGKGLGDEFLRHIERTRILVHLIDISDSTLEPLRAYESIRKELGDYSRELLEKPEIVVFSKIDLVEEKSAVAKAKKIFGKQRIDVLEISSEAGEGLDELKKRIVEELKVSRHSELPPASPNGSAFGGRGVSESRTPESRIPVYHLPDLPNKRIVFREKIT